MQNETKNCQNCKKDFIIESEDFSFYEKIKVPPPTFCPLCRLQRRMMFRNERTFYKSKCGLCDKNIITVFDPEIIKNIYCGSCWWGDGWDGEDYAIDYDPNRNFFDQLRELQLKTPCMNLIVSYATLVNSEYINHAGGCKNCYLLFNADFCENVYYSTTMNHIKDASDCLMMNNTEFAYECIGGDGSRIFFSENCPKSVNVWYSKDCINCTNCFGCVNLHNKYNCIFNVEYSKEEFNQKISELNLDKYSTHIDLQNKIKDFWNKFPRRFVYGRMNTNSTGEYVYQSKNAKNCFMSAYVEDSKFCQMITLSPFNNCYDISEWGAGAERCVDSITVGEGAFEVKYSSAVWNNVRNIEYSMYVVNSHDCFGCVNIRNKEYCILNKQYSKEEYFELRDKIIQDLKNNPYVDKKGRVFAYGDFMPYDLSFFAYNASFANQYFPLIEEQILQNGWVYKITKGQEYKPTILIENIPDSIFDTAESILKEILECNFCRKPYRIANGEFALLKRFNLPIPRSCPDCRHMRRLNRLNMFTLYDRNCDKCGINMKTSYAPERPETVYCEKCYQQEVY